MGSEREGKRREPLKSAGKCDTKVLRMRNHATGVAHKKLVKPVQSRRNLLIGVP